MRRTPSTSQSVSDRPVNSRVAAGFGFGLTVVAAFGIGPGIVPEAHAQPSGPQVFAKTPTTPLELWDAADYLVRTGQAPQAVPYLQKFLQSKPDDASLLQVRDRYGARSILRLQDDPST